MKQLLLTMVVLAISLCGVVTASAATPEDSQTLNVKLTKPLVRMISDVVYEQVPMRGYENVAMKMDIMVPQNNTQMPAIIFVTGGGFIMPIRTIISKNGCDSPKKAMLLRLFNTALRRLRSSRPP